jgi:hypothetical protein
MGWPKKQNKQVAIPEEKIQIKNDSITITGKNQARRSKSLFTLPTDTLKLIIWYYPVAQWYSLCKQLNALATEVNPPSNYNVAFKLAITRQLPEVVKLLLEDSRFDPSVRNNEALRLALDIGSQDRIVLDRNAKTKDIIMMLLQDRRVDPSVNNNEAIKVACRYGWADVVEMLLQDSRVDPSCNENHLIILAIRGDWYVNQKIVEMLLQDKRVDPSANNNEAIRTATFKERKEAVRLLLQHPRVDPSANNNEALCTAVAYDYKEIVEMLLQDNRVDPTVNKNYALHNAIEKGRVDLVKILLKDPRVCRPKSLFN